MGQEYVDNAYPSGGFFHTAGLCPGQESQAAGSGLGGRLGQGGWSPICRANSGAIPHAHGNSPAWPVCLPEGCGATGVSECH